jgi:putative endonuclease
MQPLGKTGEDLAADNYKKRGYKLLERNYIPPHGKQTGEIDLIFEKGKELVFVEVKTRSNETFGGPFEAVDRHKQRRLVRTSKLFLALHPQYATHDFSIDIAAVNVDNPLEPVIILTNAVEDLD